MNFRKLFLLICLIGATSSANVSSADSKFESFFSDHCTACHSGGDAEAGLDLESVNESLDGDESFDRWVKILDRVVSGQMPPASEDPPDDASRNNFADALRDHLVDHNRKQQQQHGRARSRRLNRYEYEKTVQDLLGVTIPLADRLPEETPLHGFDTVGDGLRFSPLHIERYLSAADAALGEVFDLGISPLDDDGEVATMHFDYREQKRVLKNLKEKPTIARIVDDGAVMFTDAAYVYGLRDLRLPHAGMYRVRIRANGFQTDRNVGFSLHAVNTTRGTQRMRAYFDLEPDEFREYETLFRMEKFAHVYPAPQGLLADEKGENVWNIGGKDYPGEGVLISWIEIDGPIEEDWPSSRLKQLIGNATTKKLSKRKWENNSHVYYEIVSENPVEDLRGAINDFAKRAFREPVSAEDIEPFMSLGLASLEAGKSYESALRLSIRSLLTSPRFLTHRQPIGTLDDHALACRLSYFLTGTMPDQQLREIADRGELSDDRVLREQTQRLIEDPRSSRFVDRFTGQWLSLDEIDATSPDTKLYPEFDQLLRQSMLEETPAFFREILTHNESIFNFVDSDFLVINRRMAEHYGIEGVQGQHFRRVDIPEDCPRGGVLTQASVLKVTANGTVTSPVRRGAFVLTRLMSDPPSAPPPGVGAIEPDTRGATTVREQLALHRNNEACARCHDEIDPPGFALEAFDVIGGFRSRYRSTDKGERVTDKTLNGRNIWQYRYGPEVDASGVGSDGKTFSDIETYKNQLLQDKGRFAYGFTKQLVTFATGHPVEIADRSEVKRIADSMSQNEDASGLKDLIHEIVRSRLFRER